MKLGKNQVLLPSGVIASKDGKYHYWACSVSGLMTFSKPEYWVKVLAKYKTEENLIKTYVCKKAQALLDMGKTKEQIIGLLNSGEKLPKAKKNPKAPKVKKEKKASLRSAAVGKVKVAQQNASGSVELVEKPVYPWQNDLHYFLTPVGSPRPQWKTLRRIPVYSRQGIWMTNAETARCMTAVCSLASSPPMTGRRARRRPPSWSRSWTLLPRMNCPPPMNNDSQRLWYVAEYGLTVSRSEGEMLVVHGAWQVRQDDKFIAGGNTYQWAIDKAVKTIELRKAREANLLT